MEVTYTCSNKLVHIGLSGKIPETTFPISSLDAVLFQPESTLVICLKSGVQIKIWTPDTAATVYAELTEIIASNIGKDERLHQHPVDEDKHIRQQAFDILNAIKKDQKEVITLLSPMRH